MNRRRAARFAAIQALYQLEQGGRDADDVAREFLDFRLGDLLEPFAPEVAAPGVDEHWFLLLVNGAWAGRERNDPMIAGSLAPGWTLGRLDALVRASLRCGAFELAARPDVPVAVVISEYVEVTRLFCDGDEPSFVHAILDSLVQPLRAGVAVP